MPFALAREVRDFRLREVEVERSHDRDRGCARQRGRTAQTAPGRNLTVHDYLKAYFRRFRPSGFFKEVEHALVPAHDVVRPVKARNVHRLVAIRVEDLRRVLFLRVRHGQLVRGRVYLHCDDGVDREGHGQHAVPFVVDVLADEVDAAGGAREQVGFRAVQLREGGDELRVAPLLLGYALIGVYIFDAAVHRDRAHGSRLFARKDWRRALNCASKIQLFSDFTEERWGVRSARTSLGRALKDGRGDYGVVRELGCTSG